MGASKNLLASIWLSFLRKQKSSVYRYLSRLDPRLRGDDNRKIDVFRGTLIIIIIPAILLAAFAACGSIENATQKTTGADPSITAVETAVVFNSSWTDPIGYLSTVNLTGEPVAKNARVTTDGSDSVIRNFNGRIYVVNRYGTDTIQVIDPDNFSVTANYSVGKKSNPQDIVVISDDKAYVSRLDAQNDTVNADDIIIINPLTGEVLGSIDLTPYTTNDSERLARAAQMALVENHLYVCMQDLPFNMINPADTNGKVAIIDTETDEVLEVTELFGRNPSDIAYSPLTDKLYVADSGVYENFVVDTSDSNGGIEVIDRETNKSEGIVIDDAGFGGGVAEIRLASEETGYTIVNSTTIASFNPTTYEIVSKKVYATPGYFLPDFAIDGTGRLLIAEQDPKNPGLVVLNPADGAKMGPIGVGAPPVSITFVDENKR